VKMLPEESCCRMAVAVDCEWLVELHMINHAFYRNERRVRRVK
jgi:hypothetical protein